MYLLMVGCALSSIYPTCLPDDDTILGSALLAGVWAGVGANLALGHRNLESSWRGDSPSIFGAASGVPHA